MSEINIFIPARLKESVSRSGAEGSRWLASLPERIAALEQAWGVRADMAFDHSGAVSWVAPVELADGSSAVLKVGFPHIEARFEAEALRRLDGVSTVRLRRCSDDGLSLLLEHCLPGTDLWSLGQEEGDAVAARILPRLWKTPARNTPFPLLEDTPVPLLEDTPETVADRGYDAASITQAFALRQELIRSQPERVLLHGDFHPGNVLAARREPWLTIDHKPLLGEPAYDLAQWLHNRWAAAYQSGDPVAVLQRQIAFFAGELRLDPARIAGWAFVKALGWGWEPRVVTCFREIAEANGAGTARPGRRGGRI